MAEPLSPGKPALSVCIANYNGAAVIETCLESVFSQDCSFEYEVLVHDDASTDPSPALVREHYPGARLLESQTNLGFCRSNNRMADSARGDYLLLLNNDTRLHPDALEALYQYASAHPCAGILTLPQYNMNSGELLDRGMYLDPFANPIPNIAEGTREVATVMGSCLWISAGLWHKLGGLPEWFGSMAEDMYLCTRVRLEGRQVIAVDQSGYDHEVGHSFGGGKVQDNSLATSYKRRRLSELNKNRVIALCFPEPAHLLILLVQALLLFTEGCLLSLVKRSLRPLRQIYLPSVMELLRDRHRLRQERQLVQSHRRVGIRQFFSPVKFTHHKLHLLARYGVPRIS